MTSPRLRSFCARALACAVLLSTAHAQVPAAAASALSRARAALGSAREPGVVLEGRGSAHSSGVDGALRVVLSSAGAFRIEFTSPLPACIGYDGKTAWTRDRTGLERAIELEESDRARLFAAVLCGRWLDAPDVTVQEATNPAESKADGARLALALPGTPMEMTLVLGAENSLPAELLYASDSGPVRWTFDDYREVGGRRLAHRWTFDEGAGLEHFEIDSYLPSPPEALLEPALDRPADFHFDPEADPELEVTRAYSGHLMVEPLIEDQPLGTFLFDTGAGISVIDEALADELGLESLGETIAVGVAGSTTTTFRRGERFELGPLVIEDPIYGALDLSFLQSAFGRRIAGIVGYDLLARSVVELEPATPRIALRDPGTYELARGAWQDLVLHHNHPCARARFEGNREGMFRLDTGANGTVTFHAPAVDLWRLLEGREVVDASSGGVGGQASAPQGLLEWFELAGRRFEKPSVSFSRADSGAFTDRYTAGNIGSAFLAPFEIVLDYTHDRIAFLPRAGASGGAAGR